MQICLLLMLFWYGLISWQMWFWEFSSWSKILFVCVIMLFYWGGFVDCLIFIVCVCVLGIETHSPFLLLLLGSGDKWSSRQLFLDAIHPTEGKRSNIHCIISGRICWKWHNFCRVKKTSVYTELSNSIRAVIFKFRVIFNFHIKIDRFFFLLF